MHRRFHNRIPQRQSLRQRVVNLHHQNHRVANDHARQRNNAEHGHKAKGNAKAQQHQRDTNQAQRRGAQHQRHLLHVLQLQHQQQEHGDAHEWHDRKDGGLGFVAGLLGAPDFDAVAQRQLGGNGVNAWRERLGHIGRLGAHHVGAHGQRGHTVAAPQYAVLVVQHQRRHLRHRHEFAIAQVNLGVLEVVQVAALGRYQAGHHVDGFVCLAVLGYGAA